jgi:hypothetical protein
MRGLNGDSLRLSSPGWKGSRLGPAARPFPIAGSPPVQVSIGTHSGVVSAHVDGRIPDWCVSAPPFNGCAKE